MRGISLAIFGLLCLASTGEAQHTALVCEGSGRLPLVCPPGMVLEINDAFYGREDNKICPHPLAYTPQTSCSSPKTLEIVNITCRGLPRCELIARTAIYGEPCKDNFNYLRVNYSCVPCTNAHGVDEDCQLWAVKGECQNNSRWMDRNCRKACLECDPSKACSNIADDNDCDRWADRGDCESGDFTSWMTVNCRKSCTRCDKPATCMDAVTTNGTLTCQELKEEGQCWLNPEYMLRNCTGTCLCSEDKRRTARLSCANRYVGSNPDSEDNDPEAECKDWVAKGFCMSNPGFMLAQCYKACMNCTKTPVCENAHDDANCDVYADDGECSANPLWMFKNCYKACTRCTPEPECTNRHRNNAECEYWRHQGKCDSELDFMFEQCWATCSRCKPKPPLPPCSNDDGDDKNCDEWRDNGDCVRNPIWMYTYCRKSCTFCGYPYAQLSLQGRSPIPGESSLMTRGRTFVLGPTMKEEGVLTHFTAFFTSKVNVSLEVWRRGADQRLMKVFSLPVTPTISGGSQVVAVDECFMLLPGDRIGFTCRANVASPIAYRFDLSVIAEPTFFRSATINGLFHSMKLPYAFSLAAAYDYTDKCPPS